MSLLEELFSKTERIPAGEIIEKAIERNISKRTVEKAKGVLGIESDKDGKRWVWILKKKDETPQGN